jgi:pimeloyl-ACP methyl ester carboxylesterase
MIVPQTRYARTVDGVNIAYRVNGQAPVDLIRVTGNVSNVEIELDEPHTTEYFEGLASFSRLILFDMRGTGLSDRRHPPDLEKRAEDLRAVLDAADSERAVILGDVSGGASGSVLRSDISLSGPGTDPQRGVRTRRLGSRLPDRDEGAELSRRARGHRATVGHDRVRSGDDRRAGAVARSRRWIRRSVREVPPARSVPVRRARVP